jgi:hypothetical protein
MADNSDVAEWIKEELFKLYETLDAHQQELVDIDLSGTHNGRLWSLFGADSSSFATAYDSAASGWEFLSYGPLLQTAWSQGDSPFNQNNPYNKYTPLLNTGARTATGCVATAAAQIMKYYNYPPTGQGSATYTWNNGATDITLSKDFSTSTYAWSSMLNSYSAGSTTAQQDAVAQLMSDVGIAFHMEYGDASTTGSSANTFDGVTVFPNNFKYSSSISAVYRTSYASESAWMQVFKNETYNSRPSQLSIKAPPSGHSVVVDGYRDSPSEQIHLNFGWAGSANLWYVSNNIEAVSTDSTNWTCYGAVIGIAPSAPSCPSLYFWNGNDYEKRGYIFPGAVDPATKYVDKIFLNQLGPKRGPHYSLEYSLQIREEELENSFIDMAKLIMVDSSSANPMELYPTRALKKVKSPISAGSIPAVEDVTYQLFSSDGQYVSLGFGDMIILTFPYFPQVQGKRKDFIFVVEGFHVTLDPTPEQK